jgi:membrane protein implicated in regulation of membrane protease activity
MFGLSVIELVYWVSTVIGGTLFLLRTLMMLFGGDFGGEELDGGMDADTSGFEEVDHDATDASFKLLSLQGLTAFFMMFGLVGLATLYSGVPMLFSVPAGVIAGIFTVWVISLIFAGMLGLQSEGTLKIENAVGQEGEVYLNIPPKGTGQVRVAVQGSLRIFDASSASGKKLATGDKIKVVNVVSGSILMVEPIEPLKEK